MALGRVCYVLKDHLLLCAEGLNHVTCYFTCKISHVIIHAAGCLAPISLKCLIVAQIKVIFLHKLELSPTVKTSLAAGDIR